MLDVFKHASGIGSTNLQIIRINFPTKSIFAQKPRDISPLAVVRCCVWLVERLPKLQVWAWLS
eukprot:UN25733